GYNLLQSQEACMLRAVGRQSQSGLSRRDEGQPLARAVGAFQKRLATVQAWTKFLPQTNKTSRPDSVRGSYYGARMSENQNFRVRLMSPLGRYPSENLQSGGASLIASAEICFSIVHEQGEVWDIPEMECFTEAELPFLASILLAGEDGATFITPYPTQLS